MKHKTLLILLTIFLVSCAIKDFKMPSWDVELTSIPLMNENFPASDLEGGNVIIKGDSLIVLIEDQLECVTPDLSAQLSAFTSDIQLLADVDTTFCFNIETTQTNTTFKLEEGEFESGEMLITYSGSYNFNSISVSFGQIVNEDETPFTIILEPSDFINHKYVVDFSDKKLVQQDIISEIWTTDIKVCCSVNNPAETNFGTVDFLINDNFVFSWLKGFVDTIIAPDAAVNVEIEYPTGIEDAVMLEEVSMFLTIYNQIGCELELMGELVAYKRGEVVDRVFLEELEGVDFTVQASPGIGEEAITRIEILNHERFHYAIRRMPDQFAYENPSYQINNYDKEPGVISSNDQSIICEYRIEIPFMATFSECLIYPDKVLEVKISEESQELIENRVNKASIQLIITNDFPVGGNLDLFISSVELEANEIELEQAELKFLNYSIDRCVDEQKYNFELSKQDLNVFVRDKVYLRTRVSFHNGDGVVIIMPSDNLKVKGFLNASVKVEDN